MSVGCKIPLLDSQGDIGFVAQVEEDRTFVAPFVPKLVADKIPLLVRGSASGRWNLYKRAQCVKIARKKHISGLDASYPGEMIESRVAPVLLAHVQP